jgi:hypothetical protein
MGAPVQIPGLPSAAIANDADQTIIRQGLTDFRCTIGLIRSLNVNNFSDLPSAANPNDFMLISRIVGGNPTNFRIAFNAVGLPRNTKTWFYFPSASIAASLPGWQLVPSTGDTLLAVEGGATFTTGGTTQGTWFQPKFFIDVINLPPHSHVLDIQRGSSRPGSSQAYLAAASTSSGSHDISTACRTTGSNAGIQLDSSWRPLASVGCICVKTV